MKKSNLVNELLNNDEYIRFSSIDWKKTFLVKYGPLTKWNDLKDHAESILGPNFNYERSISGLIGMEKPDYTFN